MGKKFQYPGSRKILLRTTCVFVSVLTVSVSGLCALVHFGFPGWAGAFVLLAIMGPVAYGMFVYLRSYFVSPYALAEMYARGLSQGQFEPPLPNLIEPEADALMKALNSLALDMRGKETAIKKLESLRIEFVANVSHELKTPLTSIRGYSETLQSGAYKDPEISLKFIKRIDENAQRLNALISDLLLLSRLETYPTDISWEVFSFASLRDKLDATFHLSFERHRQRLIFSSPFERGEGDRHKIEQILINLVDNAHRYCQDGTQVEVLIEQDELNWVYRVKDNGPGIAPEHLPRLFERFYRVDSDRSRETGGTGLGLSIVKHLVMIHGGAIQVTSQIGVGTEFRFTVPRRKF